MVALYNNLKLTISLLFLCPLKVGVPQKGAFKTLDWTPLLGMGKILKLCQNAALINPNTCAKAWLKDLSRFKAIVGREEGYWTLWIHYATPKIRFCIVIT